MYITKNKKSKKNNLDFLIDIAKQEYDNFFKRSQALDTKIGIIITITGAVLSYAIDIKYLNKLFKNLNYFTFFEGLLYFSMLGIFIAILIITLTIFVSRNTCFLPLTIFDKEGIEAKTEVLKEIVLLDSYRETLEKNDKILRKKNIKFNIICILGVINIFIVIILQIIKVFG